MAKLLVYYAHPGQRHSRTNRAMAELARTVAGITFVDLYAEYPRYDIDVAREQQRLLDHEVILFQFPLFWYSTPSLVKEWLDLVLEHGFAYGHEGDKLAGKKMMLALTAGGSDQAYTPQGYQSHPIRAFLTPLEQTARLCKMSFPAPYVLYAALKEDDNDRIALHAEGYVRLLTAIRDDAYDFDLTGPHGVVTFQELELLHKAES